jgi:type IV pilus assembly protein PilB
MTERPIQNCRLRFQFKCPKDWDALQETAEVGVRFCGECHKQVYLCQSKQEAAQHAMAGHCVALPAGFVSLKDFQLQGHELDMSLFERFVPLEVAVRYGVVPLRQDGTLLIVAMSDPSIPYALDDVKFVSGCDVEVVLASRQSIREALERAQSEHSRRLQVEMGAICCQEPEPDLFEGVAGKIIRMMLVDGHQKKEDQIQLELTDADVVVRYGPAGNRRDFMRPPRNLSDELLRQLRHAASAVPGQEGQIHLQARGQRIAYQVHFHSTDLGQEVILRSIPSTAV